MERIDVSPELVVFVGDGPIEPTALPVSPIALTLRLRETPTLAIADHGMAHDGDILLLVAGAACRRLFGYEHDASALYHLSAELRAVALAIRDCGQAAEVRRTLRGAKSIELLCMIFAAMDEDRLVPADGDGALSECDTRQIVVARRMIDERWREKLTLDSIARACGLNRAKLTRGFRVMFGTSVADAIAERRLGGARDMLLATDLPVSSIGYACGYLNNASFTRAFSRRFGMVPTRLRAMELAA